MAALKHTAAAARFPGQEDIASGDGAAARPAGGPVQARSFCGGYA